VWVFPHGFVALRLVAVTSFVAVFPLTWHYLGLRRFPDPVRVGVLVLLALNPVVATFAGMVMAELPFLACLLVLLIAVDRWDRTPRVLGPIGVAVVLLGTEAVWLKEAGIGMVLGLGLWYLLRRTVGKAVAVVGGLVALLVPVVVARLIDHVPLAGTRYSQELGSYYQGGLVSRLVHVLPGVVEEWVGTALPRTVIPYAQPLVGRHLWNDLFRVVSAQIAVCLVIGLIVTVRRHRDAAVVMIPAYVLETFLWPDINERRVVLAIPVLLAWYVLGTWTTLTWVFGRLRRRSVPPRPVAAGLALVGVLTVVVPLVTQLPRDYLFGLGQDSSRPGGSRYMAMIAALGTPSQLVETDYKYTTALFTGHRTADNAFLDVILHGCSTGEGRAGLRTDDAGYLLIGAVNKPNRIDNSCLFGLATTEPWAVRVLRTSRDEASVFELIGPGTDHPDLGDLTAGATLTGSGPGGVDGVTSVPVASAGAGDHPGQAATTATRDGVATLTWTFAGVRPVSQVSVGEAGIVSGPADGVDLEVLLVDGRWDTVAAAPHAVGDGRDHAPFLLATLPPGTRARAVRVAVHGNGQATALDVSALGPTGRSGP
jgi:hypothetical protein